MPITTTGTLFCPDCLQQVSPTHSCPTAGEHIVRQMSERAVGAVTRYLSWDYQQLNGKQQQFLNIWISDHTHHVAQHMDHVHDWLRRLTIEEIISEGMTIASEIAWIKYKGEELE
jgi:hypothetical protein